MRTLLVFCLAFYSLTAFAQKPFVGKMVYLSTIADTSLLDLYPTNKMTIFTDGNFVRIETSTESVGTQVQIKNLKLNKSYVLFDTPKGKFAVQIVDSTANVKVKRKDQKYVYRKGKDAKEFGGLASKQLLVKTKSTEGLLPFYYHKKISAKYLPGFEHFPGLLTSYFVVSRSEVFYYQLLEIQQMEIGKDMFGIPSDYKRISMNEFILLLSEGQAE